MKLYWYISYFMCMNMFGSLIGEKIIFLPRDFFHYESNEDLGTRLTPDRIVALLSRHGHFKYKCIVPTIL